MSACAKVVRSLSRYLDNEMDARERASLESHVAACARCGRELTDLTRVKVLVTGAPRKNLPPDYLITRVHDAITVASRRRHGFSLAGIGACARRLIPVPVAAIIVVTMLLIFGSSPENGGIDINDAVLGTAQVTADTAAAVLLGDA